ncbi:MAG: c-type cytochrome [bacterium]
MIRQKSQWRKPGLLILAFAVSAWAVSLIAQTADDKRSELSKSEQLAAAFRGKQIYDRACVSCHGSLGDGEGSGAKYLDPLPRDFTRGVYKFRSTPSGELPTNKDLYRTITHGIPRTMMPAWKDLLTEQERRDVVAYIKTFSKKFDRYGQGDPIEIGDPPEETPESLVEGLSLYMLMECWACHGVKGKGDGKSAKTLVDDWGHRIKPFNFTLGKFKGGDDLQSVYRTFSTGLNGTPMPAYAEAFLFGGDSIDDLSLYKESFSAMEVAVLKTYLNIQPTEEQLGNMTEKEQEELVDRRRWSLVHYVKSLSKKPGMFRRIFGSDTEITK